MRILGRAGVCLGGFTRQLRGGRSGGIAMMVGLILLGVSLMLGVAQIAMAAAGATAAYEAADLTIFMAATDVLTGDPGCATATEYAAKDRATLASCQANGWMVQAEVVKPLGFRLATEARGSAKAGPEFAGS